MARTDWMTLLQLLCVSLVHAYHNVNTNIDKLRLIHEWKSLDFDFPTAHARQQAINRGIFEPGAPVPIDVDVIPGPHSKILVTIPRFQDGVPVTLGYVTRKRSPEGNPLIAPYPNWEWNNVPEGPRTVGPNCNSKFISVFRVKVDECGRLWVLDTGKLKNRQVCPPKLVWFNADTRDVLGLHTFPSDQFKGESLFITPIVDVRDTRNHCYDTFVYIADVTGFQLIVFDARYRGQSWHIQNNLFYPYPPHGTFTIAGQSFDLMDGIFGMALGPIQSNNDRILYFHSLASVVESWVPTSVIRNGTTFKDRFENRPGAMARSFQPFPGTRPSQSGAQVMDKNGVLFYGLMSEVALGCWNSRDYPNFGGDNLDIVVVNRETLQFASGMKIVRAADRDELWVLTSAFQKVMNGLNPNEVNFRIQAGITDEIVRGSKCDVRRRPPPR